MFGISMRLSVHDVIVSTGGKTTEVSFGFVTVRLAWGDAA